MSTDPTTPAPLGRRQLLRRAGCGFGLLALADLLRADGRLAAAAPAPPLAPRGSHFPGRAKSVIWLFMYGGPSAADTFDPKPELQKHHGKRYAGQVDAFFGNPGPLLRSPFAFKNHGRSGAPVSELFPHIATCVDDIAWVRSCRAESNNHSPALFQINTGHTRTGFPSAGSWVTYGLGSANANLPGYVVIGDARGAPVGGASLWGSGFLPGAYQGTPFRPGDRPILNLAAGDQRSPAGQRAHLDLIQRMNARHAGRHPAEADLAARVESFELAYRMQSAAPELVDLAGETDETRVLYGLDDRRSAPFGRQCLLARRMVERGVRFVQLYHGGVGDDQWDAHGKLARNHRDRAAETDRPIAGLLADLKRRGLLDETLVVWGGEFGRLPVSEGGDGRDHNPHGFLTWMAGGGVRGGATHGQTDEVGHRAVVDPVSVHDLHATILHLLGLDHKRLTYEHNGRRYRLTDVSGEVLAKILA